MKRIGEFLQREILCYLPERLADCLNSISAEIGQQLLEIRLRSGRPLMVIIRTGDFFVTSSGRLVRDGCAGQICTMLEIQSTVRAMSKNSLYAMEQELSGGYLRLAGGHRVGMAGQCVIHNGKLISLKNIHSLNIRIAHECTGCVEKYLPMLVGEDKRLLSTLIAGVPFSGKTTFLRELLRCASTGSAAVKGMQSGLVDERSEIAACSEGLPLYDVGMRTDVLDGCQKYDGLTMLLRTMGSELVATDEIGSPQDGSLLCELARCGVRVLATIHAGSAADVYERMGRALLQTAQFERIILLDRYPKVGSVREIIDMHNNKNIYGGG